LSPPLLVTSARRTFSSPTSFGDGPPDFATAAAVPLSSPFRPQSACWVFGYAPCRSRPVAEDGRNSPSPNPSSTSAAVASSCVTGFKTCQVTWCIFLLRFAAPCLPSSRSGWHRLPILALFTDQSLVWGVRERGSPWPRPVVGAATSPV
jgi:hypothetical protein